MRSAQSTIKFGDRRAKMRPKCVVIVAAVGLLTASATVVATADDKSKPADRLAALKKEAKQADDELNKEFAKLGESKEDQAKGEKLYKAHTDKAAKWIEAAVDLAKADPKSDVAIDAVVWILTETPWFGQPAGKAALELARDHQAASPKMAKVVMSLRYAQPDDNTTDKPEEKAARKAVADLLVAVREKNSDKTVRGQFAMLAAWRAKEKFDAAVAKKQKDADELALAAEKAFDAAAKEFGECKLLDWSDKYTIGDTCKVELFELRFLRVGKTAPEIEGEDTDGVKFKLSDYRGKVVLLDFWGDW